MWWGSMAAEGSPPIAEIMARALPVLRRYRATRAGLFGSGARAQLSDKSDFDILVELGPELSLLDVARMNRELEEALGRRVDLVEYEALKPRIRDRVLAEEIRIL